MADLDASASAAASTAASLMYLDVAPFGARVVTANEYSVWYSWQSAASSLDRTHLRFVGRISVDNHTYSTREYLFSTNSGDSWSGGAPILLPWTDYWGKVRNIPGHFYFLVDDYMGRSSPDFVGIPHQIDHAGNYLEWLYETMPFAARWTDIAHGNGITVAIPCAVNGGIPNRYAVKIDGVTQGWIEYPVPAAKTWRSIVFFKGSFIMEAENSSVFYRSFDGMHWTSHTGALTTPLRVAGGRVFACAGRETQFEAGFSSSDGVNWTATSVGYGVAHRSGSCRDLYIATSVNLGRVYLSDDGDTWTTYTGAIETWANYAAVVCGGGNFILGPITESSIHGTHYGLTLTYDSQQAADSPTNARAAAVLSYVPQAPVPEPYLFANTVNTPLATLSPPMEHTGIRHGATIQTVSRPHTYISSLAVNSSGTLVICDSGSAYKANSIMDTATGPNATLYYVAANGQHFGGTSGTAVYHSTDGVTWTQTDTFPVSAVIRTFGGLFLVTGSSTDLRYSADGITWTTGTTLPVIPGVGVFYANGVFFIRSGGYLYYTNDLSGTYSLSSYIATGTIAFVVYLGGMYHVGIIDNGGAVYSSSDLGGTWRYTSVPQITYAIFSNNVLVSSFGERTRTSLDALTWILGEQYAAANKVPTLDTAKVLANGDVLAYHSDGLVYVLRPTIGATSRGSLTSLPIAMAGRAVGEASMAGSDLLLPRALDATVAAQGTTTVSLLTTFLVSGSAGSVASAGLQVPATTELSDIQTTYTSDPLYVQVVYHESQVFPVSVASTPSGVMDTEIRLAGQCIVQPQPAAALWDIESQATAVSTATTQLLTGIALCSVASTYTVDPIYVECWYHIDQYTAKSEATALGTVGLLPAVLQAAEAAQATTSASLDTNIQLQCAVASIAVATGVLLVGEPIYAESFAVSSAGAALHTESFIYAAGHAESATVSAMSTEIRLVSSVLANTIVNSNLSTDIQLLSGPAVVAQLTAALTAITKFSVVSENSALCAGDIITGVGFYTTCGIAPSTGASLYTEILLSANMTMLPRCWGPITLAQTRRYVVARSQTSPTHTKTQDNSLVVYTDS